MNLLSRTNPQKVYRVYIFLMVVLYIIFAFIKPEGGYGSDIYAWLLWSKFGFENGLGNIYKSNTDYLPFYHYILWLFGQYQGSSENIAININTLKNINLVFDFLGVFYVLKFVKDLKLNGLRLYLSALFLLLNVAYLYNTLVWGQVDAVFACFVFMAVYYAYKRRVLASLLLLVVALGLKLQAIIFVPFVLLLIVPGVIDQFSWKNLAIWIFAPCALLLLGILPYILAGDFDKMINVIFGSVGKYPIVSFNAYNIWYFLLKANPIGVSDNSIFFGVTYKRWGLILFASTFLFSVYPLLKACVLYLYDRRNFRISKEKILIMGGLIPILFFYFNTQMHERYSHPMLLFVGAYSILSRNFLPFVLVCLAYFMNLELMIHFFKFNDYILVFFRPKLISALYGLTILVLWFKLYKVKINVRVSATDID